MIRYCSNNDEQNYLVPSTMIMAIGVERLQNKNINRRLIAAFLWTTTMSYFNNPFICTYHCDNIECDTRAFVLNMKIIVFPGITLAPL